MHDRQTCVGCGKKSPETETNYTLISAQFGWRLTRYQGPDGSLVVEWRCPTCWRDFKRARTPAAPATAPGSSVYPPSDQMSAGRPSPGAQPIAPLDSSRRTPLPAQPAPRRQTPVVAPHHPAAGSESGSSPPRSPSSKPGPLSRRGAPSK